jgi:hypothetical protein
MGRYNGGLLEELTRRREYADELSALSKLFLEEVSSGDEIHSENAGFEEECQRASEGSVQALVALRDRLNRLIDGLIEHMVEGQS